VLAVFLPTLILFTVLFIALMKPFIWRSPAGMASSSTSGRC
jgi:hypothetical protein